MSAESIAGFHVIDGLFRAWSERDCGGALYFLIAPANKHKQCHRRLYAHIKEYVDNAKWFFMFVPCIEWCRVSPFQPMAFTPYPQGHRPCFLGEAGCFVLFLLVWAEDSSPHLAQTFLRNLRGGPTVPADKSASLIIHVFPFLRGGRAYCPPPLFLHFYLSFCLLHFDF